MTKREHHRVALDAGATKKLADFVMEKAGSYVQFGTGTQMILDALSIAARTLWPDQDWSSTYLTDRHLIDLDRAGHPLRMPSEAECREHTKRVYGHRPERKRKWRLW